MFGKITSLKMHSRYGFIKLAASPKTAFFHEHSFSGAPFDANLLGREVEFVLSEDAQGLRARNVLLLD